METKQTQTKLNLDIDVDVVIERLQLDGVFDCDRIPQHLVKQALSKWLSKIEDSINNEPDWWIRQFESKAFKSSIESFLDDYSQDSEGIEQSEDSQEKNKEFAVLS
ncbi:hypothetical protein [Planktothrix agardhii]|uniref:hypothetical protein n=1 Tax=Planktothrix agardhii TaxID=1160 RepID=UPI001F38C719|nr:hypothetical protein [Planktothrix agardhii]MCF3648036.1 hypothetical protein [Planktothrix agardhii 1026]